MNAARKIQHRMATAPGDIDWAMWVPIAEAAQRLGKHVDHLARVCRKELYRSAKAMLVQPPPPEGGNPRWFIHRSYDERLQPDRPEFAPSAADLLNFTDRQRRQAMQRAECVRRFRDAKGIRPGKLVEWIGDLIAELRTAYPDLRVSKSSLYAWTNEAGDPIDVVRLIDARGGNMGGGGDGDAWKYFRDIFLEKRQPSVRTCWERTREFAKHKGLNWPSYDSVRRQVQSGEREGLDLEAQTYHRDPRKWRSQFSTYIEQDPERFAAGECWVPDHRPLDLLCRYQGKIGRPFITSFQDFRTRRIVGWELSMNPNTSTILAALRMALMDPANGGPPKYVLSDNGKDFDSFTMQGVTKAQRKAGASQPDPEAEGVFGGVLGLLGIKSLKAQPYTPTGKAREERSFATMAARFDKTFATYTAKDTVAKPEDLAEIVKDKPHTVPSFEHVRDRLANFIIGCNANAEHSIDDLKEAGERLSPDEAMRRWRTPAMLADPAALDLCLLIWNQPCRVGRNGVRITIIGQAIRYGQFDEALRRFKGTKDRVFVAYDPNDLSHVHVYDSKLRFLTLAGRNGTGGRQSDPGRVEHVAAISRDRAQYNKSMKFVRKHRELEYLTTEELIAQKAAEEHQPQADRVSGEGSMRLVQTALDGLSKSVQRRKAAGAETMADDDGPSVSDLMKAYTNGLNDDAGDIDIFGESQSFEQLKARIDAEQGSRNDSPILDWTQLRESVR